MKVSIAIPTYEMFGRGVEFLNFQFEKIKYQTFKDFQIVISDHSKDDEIRNLCSEKNGDLDIKYVRNEKGRGKSSTNINNAIKNCDGEIIKIMFQDDFFWDETSLERTVGCFSNKVQWLVSSCIHTYDDCKSYIGPMDPYYNQDIHKGINTISSPTVLSIRNSEEMILFDERLVWLMDVEYYKALYDKFGLPKILKGVTVVNRDWPKQVSKILSESLKEKELSIVNEKYDKKERGVG